VAVDIGAGKWYCPVIHIVIDRQQEAEARTHILDRYQIPAARSAI
jgi:hypothetical protein